MASTSHEINSGFLALSLPREDEGLVPTYLVVLNHSLPKATAKLWKQGRQEPSCTICNRWDVQEQ